MKIAHIAPNAPYNEGWGYQENLLPKYQAKMGHDVVLVVRDEKHHDGKIIKTACEDYFSKDGFRVVRMATERGLISVIGEKMSVYNILCETNPDFVFYHGLVSATIFEVVKFKKKNNPNCVVVQDNHLDYNIGTIPKTLKQKILRCYYRFIFKKTRKSISKVYGVTPWRKTYAEDYFKVPSSMTDILIMGADDEKIDFTNCAETRKNIREKYSVSNNDFLIVTGGKIDKKKGIHVLMEAVGRATGVKLLVFGQVNDEIKDQFDKLLGENPNIIYVGWVAADKVYDYFFAADAVMFPGQHSVLWEQACASKIPCVFENWDGMDHVNNGGNSDFFDEISVEGILKKIEELKFTPKYQKMKEIAESEKTDIYLYSEIAKKSVECAVK